MRDFILLKNRNVVHENIKVYHECESTCLYRYHVAIFPTMFIPKRLQPVVPVWPNEYNGNLSKPIKCLFF
jgi:hypothetical protein